MNKSLLMIFILVLSILGGCSQRDQEITGPPSIEGIVLKVKDTEILVVNGITKEQAINMSWKEINQETNEKYEAHVFQRVGWFDDFSKYEVGQKVKVWGKGEVALSNPPQSKLGKIEFVD
ncbi:YobA family protein [Pontibacillus salipaludis]|uniref:YobA family protein n=1 Tax=Pontibacillus salipaludis TaxID=1697394 RepID=UPI0031EF89A3